jgi:hypothetical protein
MRNALDQLKRLVPPPAQPVNASGSWAPFEAELGICFPSDFKEYIGAYGDGEWGGFLMPVNPLAYPTPKAYRSWLEIYLAADREARTSCPDEYAGPIFPEKSGRMPWAQTGNGDVLWWQTTGSPESWTVIAWESRGPDHEYFDLQTIEFLYDWLTGKINVGVMTDHFLTQAGPVFRQSAADKA